MANVIVVGILAALVLASEWWLRRHEAKSRPSTEAASVEVLRGGIPPVRRPPSMSPN
jgi:hypothetical protein